MRHDSIVFDLDGTLWDTCPACAVAWNNVLKRNKIEFRQIVTEYVRRVSGRPHEEGIRSTCVGVPEEMLSVLVSETMIEDNDVIDRMGGDIYEGVGAGLRVLSERYRLFIVSNCQSGYIETFLRLSGFGDLFEDFECWGNTGCPKSENLRRVIERNGLVSTVMVGDTPGDQQAAHACSVPFAFVEYGFNSCEAPDLSFASFGELTVHFLSLD